MAEKLKKGLHSVGKETASAGLAIGGLLKHKLTPNADFHPDDELLKQVDHDLKASVKALKFISSQTHKRAKKTWPYIFRRLSRVGKVWLSLLGEKLLEFPEMQKFYDEFDRLQALLEHFSVHPKERQFYLELLEVEISSFLATVAALEPSVISQAERLDQTVKARNDRMVAELQRCLKAIKARDKHKSHFFSVRRKLDKLLKKLAALEAKEQKEIASLQQELEQASARFEASNSSAKLILPQLLLLFEEYVDLICKYIVSQETQMLEETSKAFSFYAVHHGFAAGTPEYPDITDSWESAATPARLQVESFVKTLLDKNPDLLDREVDDKDHKSRLLKMWLLLTQKLERKHSVKATDHVNGVFSDYTTADPLQTFKKYYNPHVHKLQTYHPEKMIDWTDIYPEKPEKHAPPPLPPRDDTRHFSLTVLLPVPPSFGGFSRSESSDSLASLVSTEASLILEDETVSLDFLGNSDADKASKAVAELINSHKNEITKAPITSHKKPLRRHNFHQTDTVSLRLLVMQRFFQQALANGKLESRTATRDFPGFEPGDLAFKAGDQVDILVDLQDFAVSADPDGPNWLVGAAGEPRRIGFVPNNYFTN